MSATFSHNTQSNPPCGDFSAAKQSINSVLKSLLSAISCDILYATLDESSYDDTISLPSAPSCDVMKRPPSTASYDIISVGEISPNT